MESAFQGIYADELSGYPYNGIARICRLEGESGVPESFGGSCREQVRHLTGALRKAVARAFKAIEDGMKVHTALLFDDNCGGYFADVTLLLTEPVERAMIPGEPETLTARTYPIINGVCGEARLGIGTDGFIREEWLSPILKSDGTTQLVSRKTHRFNISHNPDDLLDDTVETRRNAELQFISWQPSAYWNVLDTRSGELLTVRVVRSGRVDVRRSSGNCLIMEDDEGAFGLAIAQIASLTKTSADTVREFISQGRDRFRLLTSRRS